MPFVQANRCVLGCWFSMSTPKNPVIVHLSAKAVRTVIACQSACKTKTEVMAVGYFETDSFVHGRIVHRENLIRAIQQSIMQAEEMANVRVNSVTVCLSSPEMFSDNGLGDVFLLGEEISNEHMAQALGNAKRRFVPDKYFVEQFVQQMLWLDDEESPLKSAVGMKNVSKLTVGYHLMSLPVLPLNNLYNLMQESGHPAENVIFDMVAGAEYALMPDERERGVLFVDIGARSTHVCLYRQNILMFSACLPTGGMDVTLDIAAELSLTMADAERLKRHHTSLVLNEKDKQAFVDIGSGADAGVVHRYRLAQISKARYDAIFNEIGALLAEKGFTRSFVEAGVVLSGEGSQITGMVSYLKKSWQMRVHMTNHNDNIQIHSKRLSDADLAHLSSQINSRGFRVALGAMLYLNNSEFHHQQKIHEQGEQDTTVLSKLGGVFERVTKFWRDIA